MKILYSGFRDKDHSSYGGYDRITNAPFEKDVVLLEDMPLGHISMKTRLVKLPLAVLDLVTRIRRRSYDITHLFYADVTVSFFLPYLRLKRHKTVMTIHLDLKRRKLGSLFINILRKADAVITLSSAQQRELREDYGIESEFIPHGFSRPEFDCRECLDGNGNPLDADKINIVTIGKVRRDFNILQNVTKAFRDDTRFRFHLVGVPRDVKERLGSYPNVSVYGRLSDDEYYTLIRRCDYCLLPLEFATANNTVLECHYLDLPMILPDIEGISDYACPNLPNRFYSGKEQLMQIMNSLEKPVKNDILSSFAQRFEWENIYKMLGRLYEKLDN